MANKDGGAARHEKQRLYISQSDVPSVSLEKALRIPTAIGENYGYKPASPLQVAKALDVQPTTGGFKMLTGAAIAYGLTSGGYNADSISITPLGMRIVRPTLEGDDLEAKREALLRPRVVREFLLKYDGAPIPKDTIAQNVLAETGVPPGRTAEVLSLILEGAQAVGFLQDIKDRKYVDLHSAGAAAQAAAEESDAAVDPERGTVTAVRQSAVPAAQAARPAIVSLPATDTRARRVFITHGKNKGLIEPIKKLLAFGELEAVVAVQTHTVSQSVPSKVMDEMRSCGAAIIHVEDEKRIEDKEGNWPCSGSGSYWS